MKHLLKLTLAAALILCSSSVFAQKFGYINLEELYGSMPENDSIEIKLKAFHDDLLAQLEAIQVEFNNKLEDYQKNASTYTDAVRQMKEKDLTDMQASMQEFNQSAQRDLNNKNLELRTPMINRADDAVKKVSKANGFLIVFNASETSSAMAYYDEASMTNVLPMVKKELGIQ